MQMYKEVLEFPKLNYIKIHISPVLERKFLLFAFFEAIGNALSGRPSDNITPYMICDIVPEWFRLSRGSILRKMMDSGNSDYR